MLSFKKKVRKTKIQREEKTQIIKDIEVYVRKYSNERDRDYEDVKELSIISKKEIKYYVGFDDSAPQLPYKTYQWMDAIIARAKNGDLIGYAFFIPKENVKQISNQIFRPEFRSTILWKEYMAAWGTIWKNSLNSEFNLVGGYKQDWCILTQIYVERRYRKNGFAKQMIEKFFQICKTSDSLPIVESPNKNFHKFSKRNGFTNGKEWFWWDPCAIQPDKPTHLKHGGNNLSEKEMHRIWEIEGIFQTWIIHPGVSRYPSLDEQTWKFIQNTKDDPYSWEGGEIFEPNIEHS